MLFKNCESNTQKSLYKPLLPNLDTSLYPFKWHQQCFSSAHSLLLAALNYQAGTQSAKDDIRNAFVFPDQTEFSRILQNNATYNEWINFSMYGRYIQRSFSAFYRQSKDNFNADMPELLRHELMRHAQRLPNAQCLFVGGTIPPLVRQEKLLTTTLSPLSAIIQAKNQPMVIINQLQTVSDKVLGFAIKHNKRTSERLRHEVMILNFKSLTLIKEETLPTDEQDKPNIVIRYYDIA